MTPEEYIANPTPLNGLKMYVSAICNADFRAKDPEGEFWAGKELTTIEYMMMQYERIQLSSAS